MFFVAVAQNGQISDPQTRPDRPGNARAQREMGARRSKAAAWMAGAQAGRAGAARRVDRTGGRRAARGDRAGHSVSARRRLLLLLPGHAPGRGRRAGAGSRRAGVFAGLPAGAGTSVPRRRRRRAGGVSGAAGRGRGGGPDRDRRRFVGGGGGWRSRCCCRCATRASPCRPAWSCSRRGRIWRRPGPRW